MQRRRFFQVSALGGLVLASALWAGERIGGRRPRALPPLPRTQPGSELGAQAAVWAPRSLSQKQLLILHTAALRLLAGTEGTEETDRPADRTEGVHGTKGADGSDAMQIPAGAERGQSPGRAAPRAHQDALATTDAAARRLLFIDRYLLGLEVGLRADVRALLELLEHYPLLSGRFARFSRLAPAEQDAVLRGWETSRIALLRQGLQALKSLVFLAHYQDERSFRAIGYSGPLVSPPAAAPAPGL